MSTELFVGVEGGSTVTKGILLNEKGEVIAFAETSCTNHWQLGAEETMNLLLGLVDNMLEQAGLTGNQISAAGLSLSGCDGPECAVLLTEAFYKARPSLIKNDKKANLYNDTRSALETATDQGGVVLIAGTGSNCSLVDPSGHSYNCGGWGHMMGDEGGAYWISWRAMKYLFDTDDGLEISNFNLDYVRHAMHEYFGIKNNFGMLEHLYTTFKKSHVAQFTIKLVEGAQQGDPLCLHVFAEAGKMLAKHVIAVTNKSKPELFPHGLTVVCMGSVWKSWDLMSKSFIETIKPTATAYKEIRLVKVKTSGAIGAAVVGARHTGYKVPINYDVLTETLCIISS